jgi:hypothetical protein
MGARPILFLHPSRPSGSAVPASLIDVIKGVPGGPVPALTSLKKAPFCVAASEKGPAIGPLHAIGVTAGSFRPRRRGRAFYADTGRN